MDATQHAMAAKEHAEDSAKQLTQVTRMLGECLSYLIGTNQDAVQLAAQHLNAIHESVGSATAGDLAARYQSVHQKIQEAPTEGITQAISHLQPLVDYLVRLGNDTETLASVLGA